MSETDLNKTARHIDLLATMHYVLAGILAVLSFCPSLHLGMGLIVVFGDLHDVETGEPIDEQARVLFGLMFVLMPLAFMVGGWVLAAFILVAGRLLRQRRRLKFCQIVGGVECILMPIGTALGVCTLIVLTREEAYRLFNQPLSSEATSS